MKGPRDGQGAEYDAELQHWAFHHEGQLTVLVGRVYNDEKNRWPDGYAIATSPVISGPPQEGAIITTRNTRYLLAENPGDRRALMKLAQQRAANVSRRESVAEDLRLFHLLPAAWGMDDPTFEKIAGLPPRWLWQWRNHYRAPTDQELARVRHLLRFHRALDLTSGERPDYSEWWGRCWREDSTIGNRSPLGASLREPKLLNPIAAYLRAPKVAATWALGECRKHEGSGLTRKNEDE